MRQNNAGRQAAGRWWRVVMGSLVVVGLILGGGSLAQAQNVEWATQDGGTANDEGRGIGVDSSGNSYVTGFFEGMATFGATTLTSFGSRDIFVAKYNSAGTLLWVRQAGGMGEDQGERIGVDSSGNSYVAGFFSDMATFGATMLTSTGSRDIFVAKYNSAGTLLWVRQAGGMGDDRGQGIAVDSSGNSYVTGFFSDMATFGATMLTSTGSRDIFVAQYNSAGTLLWVTQDGGMGNEQGLGIAVDSSGNSYVTGLFVGMATFGATPLTSAGLEDIFVAQYDSSGTLVWVRQAGGIGSDVGFGIGVDSSGNSYVTGLFSGTATFGATMLTSFGLRDIFVAQYDSSGTLLWVTQAGGTGTDVGLGIAVDSSGNSYVTGSFEGTASFGATTLMSTGSSDIFVAQYDSSGTLVWVRQAGGVGVDVGQHIAVDSSSNSYVTGDFEGTASFGTIMLMSAGLEDIFVAKYVAMCGDGVIAGLEECDDTNTTSGDGCSATCEVEFCGDGVVQPAIGEVCDVGTTLGCEALCSATCELVDPPTPEPCADTTPTTGCTVNGKANQLCEGTSGNDTIIGTQGNDVIVGLGGNDNLQGRQGADCLIGGLGDDRLDGSQGDDVLDGGPGRDTLLSGTEADTILGGTENDTINSSGGSDIIDGGPGNDKIDAGTEGDVVYGGAGIDTITSSGGADFIAGEAGADTINSGTECDVVYGDDFDLATGVAGNDKITSGGGSDVVFGQGGNDQITSGTENDYLVGDIGSDVLDGGGNVDTLDGGAGTDTCKNGEVVSNCP